MKLLVAVYQEKNQIDEYLRAIGMQHVDIMEAGPFSSKMQAVEWAEFLSNGSRSCKMERFTLGFSNKKPWYGAIFKWLGMDDPPAAND